MFGLCLLSLFKHEQFDTNAITGQKSMCFNAMWGITIGIKHHVNYFYAGLISKIPSQNFVRFQFN